MTLVQLTYLVALDTHRHFRKAAFHCRVAQPSLSAQIRKLEEELGVLVFDRDKKPLVPTLMGERVIAQARIVLAEAEGVRDLVKSATGELAGTLRIGILPTLAPYILPALTSHFPERYPNVALVFEEMRTPHIVELIKRDLLEAGLVAMPAASRGLVEEVVFEEPLVAYVSKGHRLHQRRSLKPGDVALDDLWLLGEGDDLREQAIRLCGVHPPGTAPQKTIRFEGESLETLKRLVEEGQGMVLLPWLAVQGNAPHQRGLVKPFAHPEPTRRIRMIYSRTLAEKHLVRVVMAEVKGFVEPLLPEVMLQSTVS